MKQKATLLTKMMLLVGLLLAGVGSAWAEEETIASFTASTANSGTLNGWTINNATYATANGGYYQLTYSDRSIVTPVIDWSQYSDITITITARKYGGPSTTQGIISVSQDATELATYSPSSTTLTASSALTISPSTGAITISCPGASSGAGCGVSKIVIKGTSTDTRADAELVVADVSMEVTTTKSIDDLYLTDSDGAVSFASSNEGVAKIEDGLLKALAKGTATITVNVAATDTYKAANKSFSVTVTVKDAVAPEGASLGGSYTLVTDASSLTDGDKIIIVNEGNSVALSTTQNNNNRGETGVTITDRVIASIDSNVQIITLEGETGSWYFNVGTDAYLYAASNSSNHLKTASKGTVGNNGKAAISITESTGVASIVFQGSNSRNNLWYNSSNSLFSCYGSTSSMSDVYIYRENTATSFDITIGESGWRTLVSAQNVSLPSGVKAYTVTTSNSSSATLTEVASVKANNAYLLNGPAGDCTLTIIDTPAEPTGNLLQISTETTGNGVYVLANKSNGVGFYKWAGGSLGAGRVYLPAPSAGSREFIGFDNDATGIDNVNVNTNMNGFFDLQGRRVAQPSKGLYIVNGRKVVIK